MGRVLLLLCHYYLPTYERCVFGGYDIIIVIKLCNIVNKTSSRRSPMSVGLDRLRSSHLGRVRLYEILVTHRRRRRRRDNIYVGRIPNYSSAHAGRLRDVLQ